MTEALAQVGIRERNRLKTELAAAEREARFTSLVERQARFVFRVAYAVLRNSHDAEDVVQEIFLKIYRTKAWEDIEDERHSSRVLHGGKQSRSCPGDERKSSTSRCCQLTPLPSTT